MTDPPIAQTNRTPPAMSRRELLRAASLGGVALFLAACRSPGPSPSSIQTSGQPTLESSTAGRADLPWPSSQPAVSQSPSSGPAPETALTLGQKIAGLMVVGFRGTDLATSDWVRSALGPSGLGGVILFDRDQLTGGTRNVASPAQVGTLTRTLRTAAGSRRIIIGVDQEGGSVVRLGPSRGFPAVASEAAIGRGTAAVARQWATGIATTLAKNGFDLNFAPVVDLDVNPTSPAIGALNRSFSADRDVVVAMATIEVMAHRAAGVRTTLKHFPGIGSSTTNTDFGVADVTATWTRDELEPFRQLIAAGAVDIVMAGHVVNGQIDPRRPASLSRATIVDVLRGELGWDGIVVTDDLQAAAITRSFGRDEAILLALEAGNDLLLFANQQVYEPAIVARVVKIVEAAVSSGRIPASRIDEADGRVRALFGATIG